MSRRSPRVKLPIVSGYVYRVKTCSTPLCLVYESGDQYFFLAIEEHRNGPTHTAPIAHHALAGRMLYTLKEVGTLLIGAELLPMKLAFILGRQ